MTVILVAALVVVALLGYLFTQMVEKSPASYSNALPRTGTNVSYQIAFRTDRIILPRDVRGLRYEARSDVEGFPVEAYFTTSCSDVATFVATNSLTRVEQYIHLPDSGPIYLLATGNGWNPRDINNVAWYQRPVGPSDNLEAMIDPLKVDCEVYLSGTRPGQ